MRTVSERNPEREAQRARQERADAAWAAYEAQHPAQAPAAPAPAAPVAGVAPSSSTPAPAVGAVAPGSATPAARVDPTYAWTLAALPLVWVPVAYWAPAVGASPGAWTGALVVSALLATLDQQRLAGAGRRVSVAWALLLVPVYLILRTRAARSTPAIPVVWFAAFAASVLALSTFASAVEVDPDELEPHIARWAREQGLRGVTVSCPSKVVRAGQEITCNVTSRAGGGPALVDVVVDTDGYRWGWAD